MGSNIDKRAAVHRVPTEDKTDVYINTYITSKHDCSPLIHIKDITKGTTSDVRELMERGYIPQHLHFTTDIKVLAKDGDWYISDSGGVHQWDMGTGIHKNKSAYISKIVATTDESLRVNNIEHLAIKLPISENKVCFDMGFDNQKPLPQPSQAFVEEYVELGGIDEVLIEYTNRCCGRCDGVSDLCYTDEECINHKEYGCEDCYGKTGDIIKVDSHNTITIHPIKDSWSTKEVEAIKLEAFEAGRALTQDCWEGEDWEEWHKFNN